MKNNFLISNWWREAVYFIRYSGAGLVNTIVGFVVILSAMALNFSPIISNVAGYTVGFILGFVLSKKFVFRSNNHFVSESIRYLLAFVISFLINLLVLHLALNNLNFNALASQVVAAISYTVFMYLLTRFFVFNSVKKQK